MHREIDLDRLKIDVLRSLVYKTTPLTAEQLIFIRSHFKLSIAEFGAIFGVSQSIVAKWEKGEPPTQAMDMFIRLYLMEQIRAKNGIFRKPYDSITIAHLARSPRRRRKITPISLLFLS